jgi:hypothetical protein
VPGTDAGASARQDFHVEVDEAAQSARVFIINVEIVRAKIAFFGTLDSHSFIFL